MNHSKFPLVHTPRLVPPVNTILNLPNLNLENSTWFFQVSSETSRMCNSWHCPSNVHSIHWLAVVLVKAGVCQRVCGYKEKAEKFHTFMTYAYSYAPVRTSLKVAEHNISVHVLANAIQQVHKDQKKQTWCWYSNHFICSMPVLSVLFFFIIEHSVFIVLSFIRNVC